MDQHGDVSAFRENVRRSELPLGRKLWRIAVNLGRRVVPPPPRDCCGRDGEPGC
jgi:hypothetical protein